MYHVTDHVPVWSEKMSATKRGAAASEEGTSTAKRRAVTVRTVEKWKAENDKELNTCTWLTFEMADRDHVGSLSCSVCSEFKNNLQGMRNYNAAFIEGSKNLRASNLKDHYT